MQDPRAPNPATPFRDRSARLTLCGALSILAGSACVVLGLLHLLFLLGAGRLPGTESMPADTRSYVMGALLYGLLGAAFIRVGAGSVRKRRWARPMMLSLAWTWLLGGACVLFLLPGMLDAVLGASLPGAPATDATVARLVKIVMMVGTALFGVVVPALFVWTYNDRHLRLTCEAHDPDPDWTERCPPAVLGLSVSMGACGVITVLMALRPAVPLFGRLVTGWPAVLSLLVGAGICLWLARETYALRMRGWWLTTAFLVLVGVSTWLTLERVAPAELFRALGYPEDSLASPSSAFCSAAAWLTAALTVLTVVYMGVIRKHFRSGE
jgi:hypothetical protein